MGHGLRPQGPGAESSCHCEPHAAPEDASHCCLRTLWDRTGLGWLWEQKLQGAVTWALDPAAARPDGRAAPCSWSSPGCPVQLCPPPRDTARPLAPKSLSGPDPTWRRWRRLNVRSHLHGERPCGSVTRLPRAGRCEDGDRAPCQPVPPRGQRKPPASLHGKRAKLCGRRRRVAGSQGPATGLVRPPSRLRPPWAPGLPPAALRPLVPSHDVSCRHRGFFSHRSAWRQETRFPRRLGSLLLGRFSGGVRGFGGAGAASVTRSDAGPPPSGCLTSASGGGGGGRWRHLLPGAFPAVGAEHSAGRCGATGRWESRTEPNRCARLCLCVESCASRVLLSGFGRPSSGCACGTPAPARRPPCPSCPVP